MAVAVAAMVMVAMSAATEAELLEGPTEAEMAATQETARPAVEASAEVAAQAAMAGHGSMHHAPSPGRTPTRPP